MRYRRPPLGVRLFLSLFAVSRRFSLRPSCHLAVKLFHVKTINSFPVFSLPGVPRASFWFRNVAHCHYRHRVTRGSSAADGIAQRAQTRRREQILAPLPAAVNDR